MNYITESLSENEEIRAVFRLHWSNHIWLWTTIILSLAVIGIPFLVIEWLRLRGIEMAVTTKRVIHKRGIIARRTEEIRLEAIEAVEMTQGVWGRIFDRGNVLVYGRGTSDVNFMGVHDPLGVKREIESAMTLVGK